ncbi:MAG: metallophosphoesterase family protein [Candidatus Woesearchaeota archaeon]
MGLVALLGDVHGNLEALNAVLADIATRNVDEIYGLGDIVGYGPNPNECAEIFRQLEINSVVGNHDMTSIDLLDIDMVTDEAKKSFIWTNRQLTPINKDFIYTRAVKLRVDGMYLVHGSPQNPTEDYVFPKNITEAIFEGVPDPILVLAHTHIPFIGYAGNRMVLNPGSVGQPRLKSDNATYALVDTQNKEANIIYVPYDVMTTVRKIQESGLPNSLAERLTRHDN